MTEDVELRLNPALNPSAFREAFERDGYVQAPDLLEARSAQALAEILEGHTPWALTYSNQTAHPTRIEEAEMARIGARGLGERVEQVLQTASRGFAYLYLGYDMVDALLQGRDPDHPLHLLTELLNSDPFIEFCHGIMGGPRPTKTEAHATLYRPGDFLSLHDDSYKGERLAAFTLGFTRQWRPDWGGQLLFHDAAGEIVRGLQPGFNVLTLFRTPRPHSVAQVASYAAWPRISVVGWLRGDPIGQS
jgi:SM-20-related protein